MVDFDRSSGQGEGERLRFDELLDSSTGAAGCVEFKDASVR